MNTRLGSCCPAPVALLAALLFFSAASSRAADPSAPGTTVPAASAPAAIPSPAADLGTNNAEAARVTREMLDVLHKEIEAQVARHTGALTSTLMQIEPALNRIRQQQADAAASANRTILIAAGLFAVAGFFGLGFLTMASVRAMGRFTEVAVHAATRRQLPGPGETSGPASGSAAVAPVDSAPFKPGVSATVEQASARFQGALEQLEKRILELEHTSHSGTTTSPSPSSSSSAHSATSSGHRLSPTATNGTNGGSPLHSLPSSEGSAALTPPSPASRADMHLGKGQALLNLDQAAEALECFNAALAEEPDNTDALLRKGMALEKLEDWERALECYDRVIALDRSLTVAYLYKGGICNRLERHREALESYEQALHSERQRVTV
jgi:tetratricopeptide (TPR) repeat protein